MLTDKELIAEIDKRGSLCVMESDGCVWVAMLWGSDDSNGAREDHVVTGAVSDNAEAYHVLAYDSNMQALDDWTILGEVEL